MSTARRIAKNTTVLFISQVISYVLGLFIAMYAARYLGAGGFGILSIALSVTGIFGILTDLGLNTLTVREVARNKSLKDKYIANTTLIKILLAFLTFGTVALTVKILGYNETVTNVIYIITISTIIGAFSGIFSSIFQAAEKMEYISINNILNSVLLLTGTLIGIFYHLEIIYFALVYVIAAIITLVYLIIVYLWKFSLPKFSINLDFWKHMTKEALPFGISGIFTTIYYWIDSIMLSVMVGTEVVGWYNAAYRLIFVFLALLTIYMTSIFPVMSSLYKTSENSLKFAYERSFKYMLILVIPIAVGTTLLANKIILLIFGEGYIPAIIALQILVWTLIFIFTNGLAGSLLGSINRQMVVTKVTAIGAALNIILNLILIPKFSYIGSAAATVATEFVLFPIFIYVLLKTDYAEKNNLLKDIPKILFANLFMALCIIFLQNFNLILTIIIASIIYFGVLYLIKTFDEADFSLLRSLFKN